MAAIPLTETHVKNVKRGLRSLFPEIPSSHLSEALAASLGKHTHAALLAEIKKTDSNDPNVVILNDNLFFDKLSKFGVTFPDSELPFLGFDLLDAEGIIETTPVSADKIHYNTRRKKAWRNMMVAAINAGIEQKLFSVLPKDNRWPGYADPYKDSSQRPYAYRFTFPGNIEALATVSDAGFDELSIHVALWPTGKFTDCFNAGFSAGEAFATGWLERKKGAWLQDSTTSLQCRKNRLQIIADVDISPNGYGDKGRLII